MKFLRCAAAILLAAPVFGADGNPGLPQGLTVHEWGTFTTVAGAEGEPVEWSPFVGPSELPCFVVHMHNLQYKSLAFGNVTVRMETPVLYFYSPHRATVTVGVDFPKGLITEWYPDARSVTPVPVDSLPPVAKGHIDWPPVEITPGETPAFPSSAGASHYFAARNTDAAPLRVGSQREKLLFYRGIANFDVPVRARVTGDSTVEVRNTGPDAFAVAVLFENRGGRIGYRVMRGLSGRTEMQVPALDGSLDLLRRELSDALVSQGLYPKEAGAMVETWRDSWFEEGLRLFYLVPRPMVDRELPLSIQPAPADVARVFVGRVELLSRLRRAQLEAANSAGNLPVLDAFGRFLMPFLHQINTNAAPAVADYLAAQQLQARTEFLQPTCVR